MRAPSYSEPVVAWTDDDNVTGVEKYGVNHYESTKSLKVKAPTRPALMGLPALPPALPRALRCRPVPA